MQAHYEAAPSFAEFLAAVQTNADLWRAVYARARVAEALVARVRALGRCLHLLVLSEDWCGDAVNTVPLVARLAKLSGTLDVRLLARDRNTDIMDAHLTGTSRSIPVVIVLDEQFRECGWWGPRPGALQQWVLGPGRPLSGRTVSARGRRSAARRAPGRSRRSGACRS